jgi:ferredoxin
MKKVRIDEDLCVGDAICVDIAPDVFEMGDDDLAHVKPGKENTGDNRKVQQAVDECPASAIIIEEA